MCFACEEAQLYYRWQLLRQIARGEMPAGFSAADLRAMELPLPGEVKMVEQPDGTCVIEKVSASSRDAGVPKDKTNAFVCDSPDGE
jgi:hypothetical protein